LSSAPPLRTSAGGSAAPAAPSDWDVVAASVAVSGRVLHPPLGIGDRVHWLGADRDVPDGALGVVTQRHPSGELEVAFPNGAFTFSPARLERAEDRSARLRATDKAATATAAATTAKQRQALL